MPPTIELDKRYKFVDAMNTLIPYGAPSLLDCDKLTVKGHVVFQSNVQIIGTVNVVNNGVDPAYLPSGTYIDEDVML